MKRSEPFILAELRGGDSPRRMHLAGFTLIEVMVVVAVIGILTAIAIPSYFQYIARGHRSEARTTMTQAAQWMERWRTERGTYWNAGVAPPLPVPLSRSPMSGNQMYAIQVATPTANTYTLTAIPQGAMLGDACGNLTLDNTGLRDRLGAAPMDLCWGR